LPESARRGSELRRCRRTGPPAVSRLSRRLYGLERVLAELLAASGPLSDV
jgi:hypothetical protein